MNVRQQFLICGMPLTLAGLTMLASCSHPPQNVFQGYVEGKYVYVASSQSGRLTKLSVARGEDVREGQPLFRLEEEPETAAEREAQSAVRASEARLADLRTGKRPPEVSAIRAQLLQAQVESKKAADILQSEVAQYKAGGVSLTELINARGTAESQAALVQQLENELTVSTLPARDQQIKAQAQQVDADRALLKQAQWKLAEKRVSSPRSALVFDTIYRGNGCRQGTPSSNSFPRRTSSFDSLSRNRCWGKSDLAKGSQQIAMAALRTFRRT